MIVYVGIGVNVGVSVGTAVGTASVAETAVGRITRVNVGVGDLNMGATVGVALGSIALVEDGVFVASGVAVIVGVGVLVITMATWLAGVFSATVTSVWLWKYVKTTTAAARKTADQINNTNNAAMASTEDMFLGWERLNLSISKNGNIP